MSLTVSLLIHTGPRGYWHEEDDGHRHAEGPNAEEDVTAPLGIAGKLAVCHPCAPACRSAAAANDLAAAGVRENRKDQKYAGPCRAHDISFKGAILEVYGAMNQNCVDLVKQASKLLSNELAQGTFATLA